MGIISMIMEWKKKFWCDGFLANFWKQEPLMSDHHEEEKVWKVFFFLNRPLKFHSSFFKNASSVWGVTEHRHMHTHAHSPTLTCTLTRIHTRHIHSFIGLKQNKKQFETLGTNWPGIWYIWPVIWALSDYDIMWICSDLVNISQALIFDWFLTKK